jgi:hypothetical protein
MPARSVFPSELNSALANKTDFDLPLSIAKKDYHLLCSQLDCGHETRGRVLTFLASGSNQAS